MYRLIFAIFPHFNCQHTVVKATYLQQFCLPVINSSHMQRQRLAVATAYKAIELSSFDIKKFRLLS